MSEFLGYLITGLVSGALYSMMATGVTLTYTTSGIFNFAHGSIAFATAYVYYELNAAAHISSPVAAAIAILVFAPLLGMGLDAFVLRRLSGAPELSRILGTVGLSIAIPAIILGFFTLLSTEFHVHVIVGTNAIPSPPGPQPPVIWKITSGVSITSDQVIIFGFAALIAVIVWLIIRHTRIGLEMRAAVDGRALAEVRGVNLIRASRLAWGLSAITAGTVGVVGVALLSLAPSQYNLLLFVAAAAMVVGRMRSIPIAFVVGLLLGFIQDLVAGYLNFGVLSQIEGLHSAVPFLVLLAGLVILNRRRGRVAGQAADAPMPVTVRRPFNWRDLATWKRKSPGLIFLAVVIVYALVIADPFWMGIMAQGFVMAVVFLSFVVVMGIGGMVSLAQAGFVTMASLILGLGVTEWGIGFYPSAIVAVIISALIGVIVALPALRLSGLALALSTLALGLCFDTVIFTVPALTNLGEGWTITRPSLGPLQLTNARTFTIVCLVIVLILVILIGNYARSASGRAMLAVRGSLPAALSSGTSQVRAKLIAFAISAAVAGLGGVMLTTLLQTASPAAYPTETGLLWVTIAATIGVRRPAGAILAGLSAAVVPQLFSSYVTTSPYIPAILFGLGAVGLAKQPDGAVDTVTAQIAGLRMRMAAKRAARLAGPVLAADGTLALAGQPMTIDGISSVGVTANLAADNATVAAAMVDDDVVCALRLRNVRAGYDELEVLHGVSLDLPQGSITALLGANGAGKSTLSKVVAGAVPVKAGELLLAGQSAVSWTTTRRVDAGLFLAPESRGIFPGMTVDENLEIWLSNSAERATVYDRFAMLAKRRNLQAGQLSGGEQQILTLAPAFVRRPEVLVADEPTLGLAPLMRQEVMRLCEELRDQGTTVLLIEERARDVLSVADRVAVLELGRIVWAGSSTGVDEHALAAAYLGGAV